MRKKGRTRKRLLLSLGGCFLVPFLVVCIFGFYVEKSLEKHIELSNENMLRTIRNICDKRIDTYQNTLLQICNSDVVKRISASTNTNAEKKYMNWVLMNELANVKTTLDRDNGNCCKSIFLYTQSENYVVSEQGKKQLDDYITQFCEDEEIEKILSFLSEDRVFNIYNVNQGLSNDNMIVITASIWNDVTVGMWLDIEFFEEMIGSAYWESGYVWLILDSDNNYVRKPETSWIDDSKTKWDRIESILINDEKYVVNCTQSEMIKWQYVLLMPETVVNRLIINVQGVLMGCIILCFIMACLLLKVSIKVNYEPIRELVDIFREDEEERIVDEHLYLKNNINSIMIEYAESELKAKKSEVVLQKYSLEKILNGFFEEDETIKSSMTTIERFENKQNVVFRLEWDLKNEDNETHQIVLGMILEEAKWQSLIKQDFVGVSDVHINVETVRLKNGIVVVVSQDKIGVDLYRELGCVMEGLQNDCYGMYGINLKIAASEVHMGKEGVRQGYLESSEAASFFEILDQNLIYYEEIKDKTGEKYHYSFEMEQCIVNALREEDESKAKALVKGVLRTNFSARDTSPQLLRCLVCDLFSTILKVLEEKNVKYDKSIMDFELIAADCSLHSLEKHFESIVMYVCESGTETAKGDKNAQRCRMMVEYIKEHYWDPNLSISQIGEYFGKTSFYLSSLYKKQTGKSLATVIAETRIQEANVLLKNGCTVTEAAKRVGFANDTVFIKTFKRYTGMTPGQMKKTF